MVCTGESARWDQGWSARVPNPTQSDSGKEWMSIDAGAARAVYGVVTQGRQDCCEQWVTSYKVEVYLSGAWVPVTNEAGSFTFTALQQPCHSAVRGVYPPLLAQLHLNASRASDLTTDIADWEGGVSPPAPGADACLGLP